MSEDKTVPNCQRCLIEAGVNDWEGQRICDRCYDYDACCWTGEPEEPEHPIATVILGGTDYTGISGSELTRVIIRKGKEETA